MVHRVWGGPGKTHRHDHFQPLSIYEAPAVCRIGDLGANRTRLLPSRSLAFWEGREVFTNDNYEVRLAVNDCLLTLVE